MAGADEVTHLFKQLWHSEVSGNCKSSCFLAGCTIALQRIVFQHAEGSFLSLWIVAAGLYEKLSCCNARLSHLIRSYAAS
jgi:hypothetical protein